MIRKIILWSIFLIISVLCVVWFVTLIAQTFEKEKMRYGVARIRAERADDAEGPIIVGVSGASGSYITTYQGIELAKLEINKAGGVNGRKIKLINRDDKGSIITGRQVAQQFSDNLDMVAVIGHSKSNISVPVSVIYQYYGLLMISPQSKSSKLTAPGHNLIFRNIPTDTDIGAQMADYAHSRGYKKVAIYYLKDEFGVGISSAFENRALHLGIAIVDRVCYENNYSRKQFEDDLKQWKRFYEFDAIFLAGLLPQAATFVTVTREMGINVPIIAEESMNRQQLLKLAGPAANGMVVLTVFDIDDPDPIVRKFRDDYQDKYKSLPDGRAAQGYDSMKLLAHAMKVAKSTVPEKVAKVLHRTKDWKGVTGRHTFNGKGDVVQKKLLKAIVRDGNFVILGKE